MQSKADLLLELKQEIWQNKSLPLRASATNLVFGKGNSEAKLLFIGEAPGAKEDLKGIPFVGAAGKQLDKLLQSIGLTIDDVYIANILKYRPPNNRDPNAEEIASHTPYLIQQIKIIQPEVIATLGNFSTKFMLAKCNTNNMKTIAGIATLHGKPTEVQLPEQQVTIIPLYHPAAMLYNPNLRPTQQEDFQIIKKLLNNQTSVQKTLE
jgi:DNA polymerase|tara:strand:+ start:96 stop:719 length:624 start_codon:yes stop_codon:yes gene_type:complete